MSKDHKKVNAGGKENPDKWVETLYEKLADEDEARVCEAITDEACEEVPGNFFRQLVAQTLTKAGDRIANPKTTLPWLLQSIGAPGYLSGMLVPLRESGSLLPQVLIGSLVRRLPVRKSVWVWGSVVEGLALALMIPAVWFFSPVLAGWSVLALLAVFSLARGFCSIASKDVLGKTIPKTRRGLLTGWMSASAGVVTVAAGLSLLWQGSGGEDGNPGFLLFLLAVAAGFWCLGALVFSRIVEYAGATEGGKDGWHEIREQISLLGKDRPFRDFVLVRSLAIGSGLAAPFYVLLAREEAGAVLPLLGWFVLADGLASMSSGVIWGKQADRSSRGVLIGASLLSAGLGLVVVGWSLAGFSQELSRWFYPLAFFILGVAHSGVRVGRKTYLADFAEGNKRTAYVAVSNTTIGFVLLVLGGISSVLAVWSVSGAILFFSILGLFGGLYGCRLPKVA
ncbi:MAG: hypothetical protein LAT55_03835 [Opitutales bacterium]|nr:hypothetical protein [Opitutales bacterium]